MGYIPSEEGEGERPRLGCGPGCGCGSSGRLGERFVRDDDGALGATLTAMDPRTRRACAVSERRITRIVEPGPGDVVSVERRYLADPSSTRQLQRAAYDAYRRLKTAAEADGIPPQLLTVVSGYRSVRRQNELWRAALRRYGSPQEARHWVAPPGGSPHHTGRAIDLALGTRNDSANIPALRATPAYQWLVCNAARFGFTPYAREPWHWEYNPPPPAMPQWATAAVAGATFAGAPHPTLAPRCESLMLTVPPTYAELEAVVKRWIATCVTSRTRSAHREVALVTNNPTLVSLWNTLLKNMAGQPVKLVAEYVWGPDRVEAIRFSIPVTRVDMPAETVVVKPPLLPLPDFVRKAVDALAQQRQLGFQLTGDQVQRLTCVLRGLLAPGFDDRFVNFWDMWAYAKLMTDADPKWDLILKRATQWLEPARPSTRDARFIVSALEKMDQAIVRGIMHINQQYVNNAVNPGTAPVHDFILDRQRTPNNVYSCYHP